MDSNDLNQLVDYIRKILFKKFPDTSILLHNKEEQVLADALFYLSNAIKELNIFLTELCSGNLSSKLPDKNNFLAGELKELHANLLHLVWQAQQVAKGDYKQKVHFLGDFSHAFNLMVKQLEEREVMLKKKEENTARSLTLLTQILNTLSDWVFVREANSKNILYKNKAAENILGDQDYTHIYGICSPLYDEISTKIFPDERFLEEFICENTKKIFSIESYPIDWQEINAFVLIIKDITEAKAQEELLEDIAYKDALTGFYNRRHLEITVNTLLETNKSFAFCFIDLDQLKQVNDTFGHTIGDEYIRTVATIIKKFLRINDTVCRIGGDEFIIILPDCNLNIANAKLNSIRNTILKQSTKLYPMSISYGTVFIDQATVTTLEEILHKADEIMYNYKKVHKNKEFGEGKPHFLKE